MAGYAETLDNNARMSKRPKPHLRAIHLSKLANGGVLARHQMTEFTGKEPEHGFGANEGHLLAAHIEKHLGIKMSGHEPAPEGEEAEE